jgi:Uma2 family endonuclease
MVSTTFYTADDLRNLPEPDLPHELVRGVLKVMTPAGGPHGSVVSRLMAALGHHVYSHRLGELFSSETGFLLERDPDTVLCPDIAFVAAARLPAGGLERGFPPLAPDLAVEVLSPSDNTKQVATKVADYLWLGVRTVWVVSPAERAVHVHDRAGKETLFSEGDILDGGELLPGFRCPVAMLFSALSR